MSASRKSTNADPPAGGKPATSVKALPVVLYRAPGYLARRFQRELGTSVGQFVMTLRVEIARLMLTEHKVKLDDVAALAGFVDPSHLSRAASGDCTLPPTGSCAHYISQSVTRKKGNENGNVA